MFNVGEKVIFKLSHDINLDLTYNNYYYKYMIKKYNIYEIKKVNKSGSFQLIEIPFYTFNFENIGRYFEKLSKYRLKKIEKLKKQIKYLIDYKLLVSFYN